jgi:hypothetical protein
MNEDQVRALLGEPERVTAGSASTIWSWGEYPEETASLNFDNDKLAGWSEPHR